MDNIVMVQEAIQSSFAAKEKGMEIKLGMANAFDRVRHPFLFQVMQRFGFNNQFINWIDSCIGGLWIVPIVNGCLAAFF